MKIIEKEKALSLRRQGMTFSEILKEIPVSKGSLSYWLRDVSLTADQLRRVQYKNERIKGKFIEYNLAKQKKAKENRASIFNNAVNEIGNLSKKELKLIGIALYWAEGYKAHACATVDFTNSDPAMVELMTRWLREICGVSEYRFRVRLQVHDASKKEKAIVHWSKVTKIPVTQFTKPYMKTSPSSKNKTEKSLPYGICSIRVSDTDLFNKIQGWIKGLTALSSSLV